MECVVFLFWKILVADAAEENHEEDGAMREQMTS